MANGSQDMPPLIADAIKRGEKPDIEAVRQRLIDGGLYRDLTRTINADLPTTFQVSEAGFTAALQHPKVEEHVRYPGVQVEFLAFDFWMAVYDPQRARPLKVNYQDYQRMGADHSAAVWTQVNRLAHQRAGRALLTEIAATRHWVRIGPWYWWHNWSQATAAAATMPGGKPGQSAEAKVLQACYGEPHFHGALNQRGQRVVSSCPSWPRSRTRAGWANGVGWDARTTYTPQMWGAGGWAQRPEPWYAPDVVLFHELVHATRFMRGIHSRRLVDRGYRNEEEYLAVVVANILLSEKGQKSLWSSPYEGGGSLNEDEAKHFLDNPEHVNMSPRELIAGFCRGQPAFFHELAGIGPGLAPFNPVREYDQELKSGKAR
jgi:hypothetical protein